MHPLTPNHTPVQIPCWEWRTIASSMGELRVALAGVPIEAVQDIQETHLLCLKSSHNTNIRDRLMELKWRKQVHPDGPELWDSVLRSGFPCNADFIHRLFQTWDIKPAELQRETYTLSQFLEEVMAPNTTLLAFPVHKHEECFRLDGAACTFDQVEAGELTLEAFHIEHEDPTLIADTVRRLGLQGQENRNYAGALKHALGLNPN